MTVIAYDGKTLAADRRHTTEGNVLLAPYQKLIVVPNGAIAACGESASEEAEIEVLEKVIVGERKRLDYDSTAFVVLVTGEAFKLQNGHAIPLSGPAAIGSGYEVALGAMAYGASASEAAEIACRLVVSCGDGVDVYTPGETA